MATSPRPTIQSPLDDTLVGTDGPDSIFGGDGTDNIDGRGGNDTLDGGDRDDTLLGGTGNDWLIGGNGADSLDGGPGNDRMEGGTGNDFYRVDTANDVVVEAVGEGNDVVWSTLALNRMADNVEGLRLLAPGAADAYGNALDNTIWAGFGDNLINGGYGNDTVSYAYSLTGVSLWLALTTAQATGGSGNDTLLNIENVIGSTRDDVIRGNGFANFIDGSAGNDTLFGGGGNDTLIGGTGNFGEGWLDGGEGDDHLVGDVSGPDTASYASATSGVTVNLALHTQVTGGAGTDTLFFIDNLVGSAYADTLRGDGSGNDLDGGNGADLLIGGRGGDTLTGGLGADRFALVDSNDSFFGEEDIVLDFSHAQGDRLELWRIDADTVMPGDQAFHFIGSAAFSADATGQVRYENGVVYASVDADATAEIMIEMAGMPPLVAADFVL